MKLLDSDLWEEIFDSLRKNRTRTFLTAFGIFWGVFMLILLMGGGKGLETMLGERSALLLLPSRNGAQGPWPMISRAESP